jgi:heme/copper-type cytochrome/quinol oxidase subunit 2
MDWIFPDRWLWPWAFSLLLFVGVLLQSGLGATLPDFSIVAGEAAGRMHLLANELFWLPAIVAFVFAMLAYLVGTRRSGRVDALRARNRNAARLR